MGVAQNVIRSLVVVFLLVGASAVAGQPMPADSTLRIPQLELIADFDPAATEALPGALVLQTFVQREPGDGIPASQVTVASLAHDGNTLIVEFDCRDSEPSAVRGHLARREAITTDDQVGVLLDTFHDRRRAYLFLANPRGIQADALLTDGQVDDYSFDAVWDVQARTTPAGYRVRFEIPFKNLRLPEGNPQTWGLGLLRVVARANEQSYWPPVTRRIEGVVQQLAPIEIEGMTAGRGVEVIPYTVLDRSTNRSTIDVPLQWASHNAVGMDAKVVVRRAFAVDLTVNPDYSQVESDQPQLTSNQRFELFFPEKRPFFLENAGYFQLSAVDLNRGAAETLFFSRRIAEPDVGGRVTGRTGPWTVGALIADDVAPGKRVAALDPRFDSRAGIGVLRAQRVLGSAWTLGATGTTWHFGGRTNQVGSADVRIRLSPAWTFNGWGALCYDTGGASESSGLASNLFLKRAGRGAAVSLLYLDRSPEFQTELGFSPRRNVRLIEHYGEYRFRPTGSPVLAWGPNSFFRFEWDHDTTLRAWLLRFPFQVDMRGRTSIFVRHVETYDRVRDVGLRGRFDTFNVSTEWWRWLTISETLDFGTFPNFQAPVTRPPETARGMIATLDVQLRPTPALQVGTSYLYNRLRTQEDAAGVDEGAAIFDHHLARGRISYQFTRALSLRAIVDYDAFLSNPALVVTPRRKRLGLDFLVTYLVLPGTACYAGYTDSFAELAGDTDAADGLALVGRRFFVKLSRRMSL